MSVSRRFAVGVPALVLALCLAFAPGVSVDAQAAADAEVCEQMTEDVMTQIGVNCAESDTGMICFASADVAAEFVSEGTDIVYREPGDTAEANFLSALSVAAMDMEAESWGVNTLNLQANLPADFGTGARIIAFGGVDFESATSADAVFEPLDKSITVETSADTSLRAPVLGDPSDAEILADLDAGTEVLADAISADGRWVRVIADDTAGWLPAGAVDAIERRDLPTYGSEALTPLQAFHFRSSEADACSTLSPGLLIQGHNDYPIDLIVNDMPIRIESTVFLRTRIDESNGQLIMDLFVLFGLARVNPGTDAEIIVPPGFSLSIFYNYQPGDFDINDLPNVTRAISFSNVLPLTREILDALAFLLDIPRGILFYFLELPIISQPSGVGGVIIQIRFADPNAAAGANALCQAGVLSDDICAILGF